MAKRAHIPLKTKLASALLALGHVPYEHARDMSEDQLISLYAFDHNKLHAIEKDDRFFNLAPMLIAPHREKSKRDTGIVAKVRRLTKEQEDFQRRVLGRPCGQKREPTGNFPRGRKLRSRGFQRRERP